MLSGSSVKSAQTYLLYNGFLCSGKGSLLFIKLIWKIKCEENIALR